MTTIPALLLQSDGAAAGALIGSSIMMIIMLAYAIVLIAGIWKIFVKAGHPGWAAIVPFYNIFILLQIVGKPTWWIVLCLIPLVSLVVHIMIAMELAKCFGKTGGWGFMMLILGGILYPILGFGSARYVGAGGGGPISIGVHA